MAAAHLGGVVIPLAIHVVHADCREREEECICVPVAAGLANDGNGEGVPCTGDALDIDRQDFLGVHGGTQDHNDARHLRGGGSWDCERTQYSCIGIRRFRSVLVLSI